MLDRRQSFGGPHQLYLFCMTVLHHKVSKLTLSFFQKNLNLGFRRLRAKNCVFGFFWSVNKFSSGSKDFLDFCRKVYYTVRSHNSHGCFSKKFPMLDHRGLSVQHCVFWTFFLASSFSPKPPTGFSRFFAHIFRTVLEGVQVNITCFPC